MALHIEAFVQDNEYFVDLETLIILHVYAISKTNLKLYIKNSSEKPIKVNLESFLFNNVLEKSELTGYCIWPVIVFDSYVVAGLCSVSRKLIKSSSDEQVRSLLGFREACLMACSETSVWTRFCEIDIVKTIKNLMLCPKDSIKNEKLVLPVDMLRFEYHLEQPVRCHNVYKVAREKNNDPSISSSLPLEKLQLEHCFGEGLFMTLADVLLHVPFKLFFSHFGSNAIKARFVNTYSWLQRVEKAQTNPVKFEVAGLDIFSFDDFIEQEFLKQSLYTADPNRYKPEKRLFTKQIDIEESVKLLNSMDIVNNFLHYGYELEFDWSSIPLQANPNGGNLPKKRSERKSHQLESLVKAVLKLVSKKSKKNLKLVDFCSGSGHFGILIAYLLPEMNVILVENKERSLARARSNIESLGLKNVTIVQSNLDYFVGSFDIGVALHACGVATDLVLGRCIENCADFVCCPCCYGGIKDCHVLSYPKSKQFKELGLFEKYFNVAHAADQTHESDNVKTKQGYYCMDVIDTDRRLHAESFGYEVYLGKLQPTNCTNKNNLLVGLYKK